MLDLFACNKPFIPPAFRDKGLDDTPRIYYRPATAQEILVWEGEVRRLEFERRQHIKKQTAAHLESMAGHAFSFSVEGVEPGQEVTVSILDGMSVIEELSLEVIEFGQPEGEGEGEGEDAAPAYIAQSAWAPPVRSEMEAGAEAIAHHLDLAMRCVTKISGIRADGVDLDWKNGERLCEVFGVEDADDARRRILSSLGKGLDAIMAVTMLAQACAMGLSEGEKKG